MTPTTVSVPAAYYYSFGANRYGGAPTVGDVGLLNHGAGTGAPTFSFVGTGSAVYSSEVLSYIPPAKVADAYIAQSGQLLFMHLARTVSSGGVYNNAGTMAQSVLSVQVINGGTGYTCPVATVSAPTGSGGTNAVLGTPIVRNGSIVGIPVLSGGTNYYSAVPTIVTIGDPTGTGAMATTTMGAALNVVTTVASLPTIYKNGTPINPAYILTARLTADGSGYTSPIVSVSGGGGTGATASATFSSAALTGMRVLTGGTGYTSAPAVYLQGYASGPIATATAYVLNGGVLNVYVGNGGSGYGSAPGVLLVGGGGTGATATATIYQGVISGITVTNSGLGYTAPPTVLFTSGPYTGTATVSSNAVSAISLAGTASGFSMLPMVWIIGGGGTGATATPTIAARALNGVQLTNIGSGYTTVPAITISDPTGTGAAVTGTLGPIWTTTSQTEPWMCIPLPSPAATSDVFTYSASDMWASIPDNCYAGATTNGFVSNYTGVAEPAFQAAISGEVAPGQELMKLGVNLCNEAGSNSDVYCITGNWVHRALPQSNTVTAQPGRAWESYINPAGANFFYTSANNAIDNSSYPLPAAPGVYFSGGGGSGATATAAVSNGSVNNLTLTSGGSGYTSAPTVTIWGPGGSGATAIATVAGGTVTALTLMAGGIDYCTGLWTVMWDETDSAAPTQITLSLLSGNCTFTLIESSTGVAAGKNLIGAYNKYVLVYAAPTCASWAGSLAFHFAKRSLPNGVSVTNTATNIYIFSPYAKSTDRNPANVEQSVLDILTNANGKGSACIRTMDSSTTYGGFSSVVDPSDRQLTSYFCWSDDTRPLNTGLSYSRDISITTIQPYNLINTPYVYWSDSCGGTANAAPAGSPQPYYFTPATAAYLAITGSASVTYSAQFVTEYPHLLKTGQFVTISGGPVVSVTNGSNTPISAGVFNTGTYIFVTGPNTFVVPYYDSAITSNTGASGGVNTIATAVTGLTTCVAGIGLPDFASTPIETCCNVASKFPGCAYWITLPTCASEALALEYANIALEYLPSGQQVIVEYGNEEWNVGSTIGGPWVDALSALMTPGVNGNSIVQRARRFCGTWFTRRSQPLGVVAMSSEWFLVHSA